MTIKSIYKKSKLLLTMPHSGTIIPKNLEHNLNLKNPLVKEMRKNVVDYAVPEITNFFNYHNCSKVWTTLPRIILDVNRLPNQIDKYSVKNSRREIAPHGIIWRCNIAQNENEIIDILTKPYTKKEFEKLLLENYYPYINKVKEIMEKQKKEFDISIQLDLHSMPQYKLNIIKKGKYENAYVIGEKVNKKNELNENEILILDKGKEICNKKIVNLINDTFIDKGFKVSKSSVRKKGSKTTNNVFGNTKKGLNSLSIEIVRQKNIWKNNQPTKKGIKMQKKFREIFDTINNIEF